MLALRIEYLTGRCVATAFNDRWSAEWPPHPARIYSALAATWFETDGDAEERAALEWLASLGPPTVTASEASRRDVVPVFVPVNDTTVHRDLGGPLAQLELAEAAVAAASAPRGAEKARKALDKARTDHRKRCEAEVAPGKVTSDGKKFALGLLPERRMRQPRTFPSVTPSEPVVHVVWDAAEPDEDRRLALRRLARRVARIGHSSSLVFCDLVEQAPAPTWVQDDAGLVVLRTPEPGQLDRLVAAFQQHQGVEPRVLPAMFSRYRRAQAVREVSEVPATVFDDDWVVLMRRAGPRLPVWRSVDLATAVRGALLSHADQPPREVLTGHRAEGLPSERAHVAILPLPDVGHAHAEGALLGVAVVLPRDVDEAERVHVYRAIGRWAELPMEARLGRAGVVTLALHEEGRTLVGLQAKTWCRPSAIWASATPVALDRNPGDLLSADPVERHEAHRAAERIVAEACVRIGLPSPLLVEVSFRPPLVGAAKIDKHHPPFPARTDRLRRVQVHVRLAFPMPVRGPVVLGAGRYLGLGLLRPVESP